MLKLITASSVTLWEGGGIDWNFSSLRSKESTACWEEAWRRIIDLEVDKRSITSWIWNRSGIGEDRVRGILYDGSSAYRFLEWRLQNPDYNLCCWNRAICRNPAHGEGLKLSCARVEDVHVCLGSREIEGHDDELRVLGGSVQVLADEARISRSRHDLQTVLNLSRTLAGSLISIFARMKPSIPWRRWYWWSEQSSILETLVIVLVMVFFFSSTRTNLLIH